MVRLLQLSVRRGHSTAAMAGKFADSVKAELLVLNHHKASVKENDQIRAKEAREVISDGTRVLSATDFMEVAIPREGFQFLDQASLEPPHRNVEDETSMHTVLAPKGALLPTEHGVDLEDEAVSNDSYNFGSNKTFDFSKKLNSRGRH